MSDAREIASALLSKVAINYEDAIKMAYRLLKKMDVNTIIDAIEMMPFKHPSPMGYIYTAGKSKFEKTKGKSGFHNKNKVSDFLDTAL